MPPVPRQRYNAKARQSSAGGHKKGKAKKKNTGSATIEPEEDTNALIAVPKSVEEKELDRRERLRQELLAQSESKLNSKKKKRLEKYIEKKLKQEERVVLFEKLSKSQAQLANSLQLKSSATLGTGKTSTHQERFEKDEHQDVKRAIDGVSRNGKRKRSTKTFATGASDSESHQDSELDDAVPDEVDGDLPQGTKKVTPQLVGVTVSSSAAFGSTASTLVNASGVIGSALQRSRDGSIVAPRVVKRKKLLGSVFASWKDPTSQHPQPEAQTDSDTSFDSSDSACDSDSDDGSEDEWNGFSEADNGEENTDEGESIKGESTEESITLEPSTAGKRKLGFKDWAMKQLSVAKSYIAPADLEATQNLAEVSEKPLDIPPSSKRRKIEPRIPPPKPGEMRGPLGKDMSLPSSALAKHLQEISADRKNLQHKVVNVTRPLEVEESRLLLPIVAEEQPIMEAILLNSVVVICGETGSGKTTQVPQFLYEAGFGSTNGENPGMIGITQPRRVAAISMASRVAHELSLTSSKVSYQIRYDATVSPDTSIKFMTDGVLLRELATDFLLTKYSVIIIDEAHERSMNTDILIGVLSRVIKLREEMWLEKNEGVKPLRLIIMSATLRVSDFAENTTLFSTPPPIINVAARQHPVTVHFSRRTASDYVTEAVKKASKIHARLPPGGILIFLTGQNEISGACKKLEGKYGIKALELRKARRTMPQRVGNQANDMENVSVVPTQADVEAEDIELGAGGKELALDVDDAIAEAEFDPEALDSGDEDNNEELGIDSEESEVPMHVVPLFALLSSEKQMQVFKPPPPGSRLVVVSTNVAETSLTIPGIRYVIDCGRAKERRYDVSNGIQAFQVSWVSKASAAQRAGRAGRTGPGHCYRLYSSALYENFFDQFSQPEILRMPIEGVVLQMKSMHIDAVVNFPFPTSPDRISLQKAEKVLTHLGALSTSLSGSKITDIGRAMSLFPLSPRFSRMLVSGRQHGCLPYVIAIVAALSVGDPFLREEALEGGDDSSEEEDENLSHLKDSVVRAKEARRLRRRAYFLSQETHASLGNHISDIFRMLSVVGAYEYAGGGHQFCADHFVRPKAMEEIHKLRAQISHIVQTNFSDIDSEFIPNLQPPSTLQLKVLRQLLTAGFIDQVAVRKDKVSKDGGSGRQYTTAKGVPYQALGIAEDVFIHPSSVIISQTPPDFVIFMEVVRTTKVWIKGVTVINPVWLSSLGKTLCTFSKPVRNKDGIPMVVPRFGPDGWELPAVKEGS